MKHFLQFKALIAVILFAILGAGYVTAQNGQSPTSPRPRPDLPADSPFSDDTNAQDARSGRFSTPANPEEEKSPPTRRTRSESVRQGSTPGIRTVTGSSATSGSTGLVTGNGAAPGSIANGRRPVPNGPVLSMQGAENFDAILQREVVYGPLPEGGETLIDLTGPATVSRFMDDIRVATLWNILVSEEAKAQNLDFYITEATPQQAMEVLKFHDLYYEFDPKTNYVYVMTIREWQEKSFGELEQRVFALEHIDGDYIHAIVQSLASSRGKIVSDPRTRHLYVWDTVDNLELMEAAIAEADVPFLRREFKVVYADFADIQAALTSMLSPNGSLLPDPRTSTLLVWDQPDVLTRMTDALETIDVPVASRTFYVTHVQVQDMLDYLEVMLSERGILQIDPRYNAIIVTDLPGRLDRIADVLEVLDQELDTRTWVVDYADLDFLADQIESKIPVEMGEIVVHEAVHQITVSGTKSRLDEIDKLIKVWDVPRKQVQIEAFIVEVGSDVEREFNINWSYFGSSNGRPIFADGGSGFNPDAGNLNVGQLPYTVPLYGALELDAAGQIVRPLVTNTDGENVISRVEGNNLAVTLEYLDQKNKATVLSSPRVAVQDGEEATFENATQVPFVSSTTFFNSGNTNNFGSTNNTNRVEFIDVGTILRVLPRITTKENILLDISAEDSTFIEVRVLASDQQSTVPQKTVRRAETQLRVQSGDTVVLGGLRRDRAGKTETRTPFLGDIPGIGRLFRYPNKQSTKNTLLIFITPTIVDEFTDPQATILAAAEEEIADEHRHNQKNLWGRIADTVSDRENELTVSVGQSGDIHVEGERADTESLTELFADAPANVRLVLRRHPRAPEEVVNRIIALAESSGRKIDLDDDLVPLVPRYRDETDGTRGEITLEASTPVEPK